MSKSNLTTEARSGELSQVNFLLEAHTNKMKLGGEPVYVHSVNDDDTINVIPRLYQQKSGGQNVELGIIYHVPYLKLQSGSIGIKIKPVAGDVGEVIFNNRDISLIKKIVGGAKKFCQAGSHGKCEWESAVYVMSLFMDAPASFIELIGDKIAIESAAVSIKSNQVDIDSKVKINGDTEINGSLKNNGINVGSTHLHGGVYPGGAQTTPPVQ